MTADQNSCRCVILRRDYFYKKAKREGYRTRASYKLKQINKKFNVIGRGDVVLDLGAAPGGWLQVAKELSMGTVIGVDLQKIEYILDVKTIRGDITIDETIFKIKEEIQTADVVVSDASPNLSGNWSYDHARSIELSESALKVAEAFLKPGGNFVVKVFRGDLYDTFLDTIRKRFGYVRAYTPEASRKQSAEIYLICKKYKLEQA